MFLKKYSAVKKINFTRNWWNQLTRGIFSAMFLLLLACVWRIVKYPIKSSYYSYSYFLVKFGNGGVELGFA